jgi:hypothetical protein
MCGWVNAGKRIQEDRRQMAEDGLRLGLPESRDGVREFILEDFDDFLFSV